MENDTNATKSKAAKTANKDEPPKGTHYHYQMPPTGTPYNYPPRKLYRSTRDKWLGGVCGGIAEHYNTDPVLVRIIWVVVTLVSMGIGIIAYILLLIFVEKYPSYYFPPTPTGSVHYHYHGTSNK